MLAQSKSNGDGLIRALEFLAPAALVIVLTLLFVAPWVRIFPHIDEGLYMYQATRILEGQVIYRDFFQFTTPGVYYLLAAAYKIFGNSVLTGRLLMLALEMSMAYMVFLIARRFVPWAAAVIAAGAYAVWLPESKPCLQHHTLSMFFAFACLTVILYMDHARWRGWIVAGALTFACALTTQSTGTYVAAAVALGLLADIWVGRADFRQALRSLTVFAGAILILTVLFVGLLLWAGALDEFVYCTVTYPMESYLPFHAVGGYFGDEIRLVLEAGDRWTFGWMFRMLNTAIEAFSQFLAFAWAGMLLLTRRKNLPGGISFFLGISAAAYCTTYPAFHSAYTVRLFSPLAYLLFFVLGVRLLSRTRVQSILTFALQSSAERNREGLAMDLNVRIKLQPFGILYRRLGSVLPIALVLTFLLLDSASYLHAIARRVAQSRAQRIYLGSSRGSVWVVPGQPVTRECWEQISTWIVAGEWVFVYNWSSWIHYLCNAVNRTRLDGLYPDYSSSTEMIGVMHILENEPPRFIVQDHLLERLRDNRDPRFVGYRDGSYHTWPPNVFAGKSYREVWHDENYTILKLVDPSGPMAGPTVEGTKPTSGAGS